VLEFGAFLDATKKIQERKVSRCEHAFEFSYRSGIDIVSSSQMDNMGGEMQL
jgi:hypothetical protein